jgi:hypothetical protein
MSERLLATLRDCRVLFAECGPTAPAKGLFLVSVEYE